MLTISIWEETANNLKYRPFSLQTLLKKAIFQKFYIFLDVCKRRREPVPGKDDHCPPSHMTWDVTDSLLNNPEVLLLKTPSLAEPVSEYILDERPKMPMLSHTLISGVLWLKYLSKFSIVYLEFYHFQRLNTKYCSYGM